MNNIIDNNDGTITVMPENVKMDVDVFRDCTIVSIDWDSVQSDRLKDENGIVDTTEVLKKARYYLEQKYREKREERRKNK